MTYMLSWSHLEFRLREIYEHAQLSERDMFGTDAVRKTKTYLLQLQARNKGGAEVPEMLIYAQIS
jgi:hypothetical protein